MSDTSTPRPASERVRLKRGRERGSYDADTIVAVLDAGIVAHVGVDTPDGPLVLPTAYGHDGTDLYLHGAAANGLLRASVDRPVCVSVTVLDGLVFGRSPLHNSANYRAVVVRGTARRIDDADEKLRALQLISDHVVANWDRARVPTPAEVTRTLVVAVALTESSAKIRSGGPGDEPHDLDGPHWGGWVPIAARFDPPIDSPDLPPGVATPPDIEALAGVPVHPRTEVAPGPAGRTKGGGN